MIPVFAWAALLYIQKVKDIGARRGLVGAILLATLFCSYAWGPVGWSPQGVSRHDMRSTRTQATSEAVALIPDGAVVAARSRLTTHLTHRDKVYEFPTPFSVSYWGDDSMDGQRLAVADEVEYVLETPEQLSDASAQLFANLQETGGFREIFSKEGVVLLRKMGPVFALVQLRS